MLVNSPLSNCIGDSFFAVETFDVGSKAIPKLDARRAILAVCLAKSPELVSDKSGAASSCISVFSCLGVHLFTDSLVLQITLS